MRWRGRGEGAEPVFLNISEPPPPPAERNCVIMPDFFYDSNQGHCLWERAARLCAEQPGSCAAQNESSAARQGCRVEGVGVGGVGGMSAALDRPVNISRCYLHNSRKHAKNKQGSAGRATFWSWAAKQEPTGGRDPVNKHTQQFVEEEP